MGQIVLNSTGMKIATIIARILLGLVFTVFGSNVFLASIPYATPTAPMSGPAGDFMTAMFTTHYVYVVGGCQVLGGLILLIGRYVPLGLTLLGPVIVNILTFHICMAPQGLPLASVVAVLALFLLWRYRAEFS